MAPSVAIIREALGEAVANPTIRPLWFATGAFFLAWQNARAGGDVLAAKSHEANYLELREALIQKLVIEVPIIAEVYDSSTLSEMLPSWFFYKAGWPIPDEFLQGGQSLVRLPGNPIPARSTVSLSW